MTDLTFNDPGTLQDCRLVGPDGDYACVPRPLVVVFHGAGGGIFNFDDPVVQSMLESWTGEGFRVLGCDAHGFSWGNTAAQLDYLSAIEIIQSGWSTSQLLFWAGSMGALVCANLLSNYSLPKRVAGVYWTIGAFDLDYVSTEGDVDFSASVAAAYPGGYAGNNPMAKAGNQFRGIRHRFIASPDDLTIITAHNTTPFAAKVAPYSPEATVVASSGTHADSSHIQLDDILSFYKRAIAATETPRSLIGAFRFDDVYADSDTDNLTRYNEAMQPEAYHGRLQPFAKIWRNGTISQEVSQATMDAEIKMAASAGVDYFAYDTYFLLERIEVPPYSWRGLGEGYEKHITSPNKGMVRHCPNIVQGFGNPDEWPDYVDYLVDKISDNAAMRVFGRPLIFWYGISQAAPPGDPTYGIFPSVGALQSAVALLRSEAVAAGLLNPYIVAVETSVSTANDVCQTYGLDAISAYAIPRNGSEPTEYTYDDATNDFEAWWALALSSTSRQIIPPVSAGWDRRPLVDVGFFSDEPYCVGRTPAKFVAHATAAQSFIAANPTRCLPKMIQIGSWNENLEGSYFAPTIGDMGKNCEAMANAFRRRI